MHDNIYFLSFNYFKSFSCPTYCSARLEKTFAHTATFCCGLNTSLCSSMNMASGFIVAFIYTDGFVGTC